MPKQSEYKEIENKSIAEIVERLQSMAQKAISKNYTISSNKVTQAMVDEAQAIISNLLTIKDREKFNDTLLKLFTVIPRKMGSVDSHIAHDDTQFAKIISREQDLLDIMKGQIVQKQAIEEVKDNKQISDKTIIEQLGLEFEECSPEDIAMLQKQENR